MRVRVRFSKLGKVRWTSHRDVARMWERALRRAGVPVALTAGFSPRPRISFGLALSTGHESLAEYLDVDVEPTSGLELAAWPHELTAALPIGLDLLAAAPLGPGAPSLQQEVTSCSWLIELPETPPAEAADAVAAALAARELVAARTRKGHEVVDDLRPAILALEAVGTETIEVAEAREAAVAPLVLGRAGSGCILRADLATQPRSLRPSELLAVGFANREAGRIVRTHQWIDHDGERTEPLGFDVAPPPLLIGAGT